MTTSKLSPRESGNKQSFRIDTVAPVWKTSDRYQLGNDDSETSQVPIVKHPTSNPSRDEPEFDSYADNYDEALQQGLDLTGENKEYFAEHRVLWIKKQLDALQAKVDSILDFGCGTGGSIGYLRATFSPSSIEGTDVSEDSLKQANTSHGSDSCQFHLLSEYQPGGDIDLAFCNGVFHHIPLAERQSCSDTVYQAVRPGGYFCFWENNPWNPGTRWVMKRVPFDRDAIMLWPGESRRLLRQSGFEIVGTQYCFFFPSFLKVFRPLEPYLSWIPFGGQYLVIARKP